MELIEMLNGTSRDRLGGGTAWDKRGGGTGTAWD